ncbi:MULTISPECIES: tetratricopeptide repeat protein [Kitasatospora]|uniref:Tetratricopeptide (TPR) repeat protein n=2 Tax=Kitasatospora TaxID=2063 RepID=A0ABT1J874_9ACTN|nr:tetratricopeptide repeat protein [Kitasatospora paracochleata]MCP2313622.1 tetratricopeptide (TPR) repeat protein [Kitasatospora paracochleata]
MTDRSGFRSNTFSETMLGLQYATTPDRPADLFSQACVEQYEQADPRFFGYLFAQVFEPNVLHEVALLEGVPYSSLRELGHRPTPAMARLAESAGNAADLPVVGLVNVAAALISVSRFDLAVDLLGQAERRAGEPRERFEIAMLEFIVANRRDDGTGSPRAFLGMRRAIETGAVPADRAIDACTQAVVWFMKRRELPEAEFAWYLETGKALAAAPAALDPASLSSWYRGLAMVPAAEGSVAETRRYMRYAQEAADETYSRRPRAYELHFMKTYHESTMKEHMYLTGDRDGAEEAGHALIALDPVWSVSHGELAEAYVRFGRIREAAESYERAVAAGPPYVGHHLLHAARCHEKLGNRDRALEHYLALSELARDDESVLRAGLDLAQDGPATSRTHFERALARLGNG